MTNDTTKSKQNPSDFQSTAALETRYHGPTNTLGSRVSARRADHRPGEDPTIYINWAHNLNSIENHARAALAWIEKHGEN